MSEAVNVCLCSETAGSHSGVLMSVTFAWIRPFDLRYYYYYYYYYHRHHHHLLYTGYLYIYS